MIDSSNGVTVTEESVQEILSTADYLDACDRAFRLYGQGDLINPEREISVERSGDVEVFRLDMPAEWAGRYRGRKIIEERSSETSGRLGGRTAVIELEDLETGRRATVAAEAITNGRTGAAAVLGACYLGPDSVDTAAVVGTGRIAEWIVRCIDEKLGCEQVRVTSRSEDRRRAFVDRLSGLSTPVKAVLSIDEATEGADAVFTAMPTPTPVILDRHLNVRTHLSVVAGDPRSVQVSPDVLKSRRIVPDHVAQARVSGDFADRPEVLPDDAPTVGDAALDRLAEWRGTGTICYLSGLAAQDLMAAVTVLERSVWSD